MRAQPRASHFINGEYVEDAAGEPFDVIFPATGECIARLHSATEALRTLATNSARKAQAIWASVPPNERSQILQKAARLVRKRNEEIAQIETLITGRALQETLYVDGISVAQALEFFGGVIPSFNGEMINLGGSFAYTRREPLGICLGIGPWNYPFQGAGWKSAPALAAGNAMIFKPSENAPLSALILAEIYAEAGLPPGIFNVLQGKGDVGHLLVVDPAIAKVSLTGSVPTGRKIMSAAGALMKHTTMELGGKSPLIIFDDCDFDNAIKGAMNANFFSTGQICTNGTRLFVQSSLYNRFVDEISSRAARIKIGNPLDQKVQMGPINNARQHAIVQGYIASAISEGATLSYGGNIPCIEGMESGFWIEPTVFSNVTDDMRIANEEVFGPVMSILKFDSEEEVIERANATPFGLAAGVFTNDISKAHRVVHRLQSGMCWINNYNIGPVELPFGGYKDSGIGRECSIAALEQYTQIKTIYVELNDVESPFS